MNSPDISIKQNAETLAHLLGVVTENREHRCAEVSERTRAEANEIIKQAHARVRGRLRRHIVTLREQYRVRIAAAQAHKQTLIRQQHQKSDKAILEAAWPVLREVLLALWMDPVSRQAWTDAAIASAESTLLETDWRIEHPRDFTIDEHNRLKQLLLADKGNAPTLLAGDDIEAGIRIIAHGTVIDATLEGLLQQKATIEATLIARIEQDVSPTDGQP